MTQEPEPMMRAAVQGTTGLMDSALAASRSGNPLRSVLFMSSISAVFSPNHEPGYRFDWTDWHASSRGRGGWGLR